LLAYANLTDSAAHSGHRLPVRWVVPVLDSIELVAALATRTEGELSEVIEGVANELDPLHSKHYTRFYMSAAVEKMHAPGLPPVTCPCDVLTATTTSY
jgi:hypothetical protein